MIIKNICILFLALLLVSCKTIDVKTTDNNLLTSGISICGGGLDKGLSATIEAEYKKQKLKGNIDAGFKQYVHAVLDANGASEEKYERYINCVLEVDGRERKSKDKSMCINSCDKNRTFCISDNEATYNQCIRKGQSSCMVQCATVFGLSKSQCVENCDMNKSHNIGQWEKNHGCISATNNQCDISYNSCTSTCN